MITLLLLALANPALDRFDAANLALTGCGFAAHREAASADRTLEQFRAGLPSRCAAEIAAMRHAIAELEIGRGKARSVAEQRADRRIAEFDAFFAGGYARRHEDEAKLRALANAVNKEGGSNAE